MAALGALPARALQGLSKVRGIRNVSCPPRQTCSRDWGNTAPWWSVPGTGKGLALASCVCLTPAGIRFSLQQARRFQGPAPET